MTTTSPDDGLVSLAYNQQNKYRVVTGCAPSAHCRLCQGGRKRYRDTRREGKSLTTEFKHVGLIGVDKKPGLVLCEDQIGPERDLTGRF